MVSSRLTEMVDITYRTPVRPTAKGARFPGFAHGTRILPKGTKSDGHLSLSNDIEFRESVPMHLSVGIQLHSDIFLPADRGGDKIPALVAWSPYGKQGGTTRLDDFPGRAGVPRDWTSGFEKWEGPDPAYWCHHNYAVINVDSRGAYTSEGDLLILGREEANDAAEFTTWVSQQEWCNGRVAFTGNSWLTVIQWHVASLKPKGLFAIAPWEGFSDLYHDLICAGGVPNPGFVDNIIAGNGRLEDIPAMLKVHPQYNEYWESKRARIEDINVPVYCVASWTNPIHTPGTFNAWNRLRCERWLRVHALQEWSDYYTTANVKDLHRFFDYYLKDAKNDWIATPRVRLSVLSFGLGTIGPILNRSESEFPIPRTQYTKYYLLETGLSTDVPDATSKFFDARSGALTFSTKQRDKETTGYFTLHLCISADQDDIDIYAYLELLRADRRQGVLCINPQRAAIRFLFKLMHDWQIGVDNKGFIFYWGPSGCLRSRLDEKGTTKKGDKRVIEIPMKPAGISWHEDDEMRLTVCGRQPAHLMLPGVVEPQNINQGDINIHFGEDSYLLVPLV